VTDDTKASSVSQDLPRGLRACPSESAGAVRGGQRSGALAGSAVVAPRRWSAAHRHEYRRPPNGVGTRRPRGGSSWTWNAAATPSWAASRLGASFA
jgi:hypothetical protein